MVNRDKLVELRRKRQAIQRQIDDLTVEIEAEERRLQAWYDALLQNQIRKIRVED